MAILSADKRDVQINGDFKTSGFKIQASAKAFEILSSNIYTNKVRAVIREYNCNAYDAHVASGNGNLGMFTFLLVLNLTSRFVIMGLDSRTSRFVKYLLLTFILLKLVAMILWEHWV